MLRSARLERPGTISPRHKLSSPRLRHVKIGSPRLLVRLPPRNPFPAPKPLAADARPRPESDLVADLPQRSAPAALAPASSLVVARELLAPLVHVPVLTDYRDLFAVIDARERSVQAIKGFVASLSFIRGSARALPPEELWRSRAKLARLLARLRTHSTNVIELVHAWRRRPRGHEGLATGASAAALERARARALAFGCGETDGSGRVGRGGASSSAGGGYTSSSEGGGYTSSSAGGAHDDAHGACACAWSSRCASAGSASGHFAPVLPPGEPARTSRSLEVGEPFVWLGRNYVLKMCGDLPFAPLPQGTDPLLLNWFHYDAGGSSHDEGLACSPVASAPGSAPEDGAGAWAGTSEAECNRREAEWWFDAERLHSAGDVARMRAAQQSILDEARASSCAPPPLDERFFSRPGADVSREMELLLYGAGGFREKLRRHSVQQRCAVSLQVMARFSFTTRRVALRRATRQNKAAAYIQDRYRNRRSISLSGKTNVLASVMHVSMRDQKQEAAARKEQKRRFNQAQEARRARMVVLQRRWAALRSCLDEIRRQMSASLRLQCLVRVCIARKEVKKRLRAARLRMRNLSGPEYVATAQVVQKQFRKHMSASRVLADQYEQRKSWVVDSHTAHLLQPLACDLRRRHKQARRHHRALVTRLESLRAASPEAAGGAALSELQRKAWGLEGELKALGGLRAECSLDGMMRRRLQAKRAVDAASAREDKLAAAAAHADGAAAALRAQYEMCAGAVDAVASARDASSDGGPIAPSVLLTGQLDLLRRRVTAIETRLAAAERERAAAQEALRPVLEEVHTTGAAMELYSGILSTQSNEAGSDFSRVVPLQTVSKLILDRSGALDSTLKAIRKLEADAKKRGAAQSEARRASGGRAALAALHRSAQRNKHSRLERKRTEALGHCIATANAKVAYRQCKRAIAEVAGCRELLGQLESAHATLPRPQLLLELLMPGGQAAVADAAEAAALVVDDVLVWMGLPDAVLDLTGHSVRAADDASGLSVLCVAMALNASREGASLEPQCVGPSIVSQAECGHLAQGLAGTAAYLDVGHVQLHHASFDLPSRAQMVSGTPSLASVEAELRADLDKCQARLVGETETMNRIKDEAKRLESDRAKTMKKVIKRASFFITPGVTRRSSTVASTTSSLPADAGGEADAADAAAPAADGDRSEGAGASPSQADGAQPPQAEDATSPRAERTAPPRPASLAAAEDDAGDGDVQRNSVAVSAASALSAFVGTPGGGTLAAASSDAVGGGTPEGSAPGLVKKPSALLTMRMNFNKVTGTKERLIYFRARADGLLGKLRCLERIRVGGPSWAGLTCTGDAHVVDERWNMGTEPAAPDPSASHRGRFCAHCALRRPPVLARHRYVDCAHRMLAAEPEYSAAAVAELRAELDARERRTARLLARFESVVERRRECKALLDETLQSMSHRRKHAEAPVAARAPETGRPGPRQACCPHLPGRTSRVRSVLRAQARASASDNWQLAEAGGHAGVGGLGSVWGEMKAVLVMSPRRSLMHGGLAELEAEAAGGQGSPAPALDEETSSDESDDGAAAARPPPPPLVPQTSVSALLLGRSLSGSSSVASPRPKRSSLQLWDSQRQHLLFEPRMLRREAARLDANLSGPSGDYLLLPLVIELINAPLPGGWSEVMKPWVHTPGEAPRLTLLFLDETTGTCQLQHPLTETFRAIAARERRRGDSSCLNVVPQWLQPFSERLVQFVGANGRNYFHDFAHAGHHSSLLEVFDKIRRGELCADQPDTDTSQRPDAAQSPPVPSSRPPPLSASSSKVDAAGAEAAAAAALAASAQERQREEGGKLHRRAEGSANSVFSMLAKGGGGAMRDALAEVELEELLRSEYHAALRRSYAPLLGLSLVAAPRQLRKTIEVALAYGISPAKEPEHLWLADLALSLPVPIGWERVADDDGAAFWYNHVSGASQWQHPIDDFIKCTLAALRAPLKPSALPHIQAVIGVAALGKLMARLRTEAAAAATRRLKEEGLVLPD